VVQWVQGDLVQNKQTFYLWTQISCLSIQSKRRRQFRGHKFTAPNVRPVFQKKSISKNRAIGLEKNAIGTPIGKVPVGKQSAEEIAKV